MRAGAAWCRAGEPRSDSVTLWLWVSNASEVPASPVALVQTQMHCSWFSRSGQSLRIRFSDTFPGDADSVFHATVLRVAERWYDLHEHHIGSINLFLRILLSRDKSPGCTEYNRKLHSCETDFSMVLLNVVCKPSHSEPGRTLLLKIWFPDQLHQHWLDVG